MAPVAPASLSVWQSAHGGTAPTVNSVLPSAISAASSSAPLAVPQRQARQHGADGAATRRRRADRARRRLRRRSASTAGSVQLLLL